MRDYLDSAAETTTEDSMAEATPQTATTSELAQRVLREGQIHLCDDGVLRGLTEWEAQRVVAALEAAGLLRD